MSENIGRARLGAKELGLYLKLRSNNIPTGEWNKGNAKGVRDLAGEVLRGESTLFKEGGELIRRVEEVHIDIRYTTPEGVELQLVEDRQEFNDGRVRERGHIGVREKAKPKERSVSAARRGIAEELGITRGFLLESLGTSEEVRDSGYSYPGLKTKYIIHEMKTKFEDEAYNPEGYKEVQADKTTYFVWREVENTL